MTEKTLRAFSSERYFYAFNFFRIVTMESKNYRLKVMKKYLMQKNLC